MCFLFIPLSYTGYSDFVGVYSPIYIELSGLKYGKQMYDLYQSKSL